MLALLKRLRDALSLWADVEQVSAPPWKQIIGYGWAIATGIYAVFQNNLLAAMIGAPIAGYCIILALEYLRPTNRVIHAAPSRTLDLATIDAGIVNKPRLRYAPPKGKEDFPIGSLSFNDLGEMMIKLSKEIIQFLDRFRYDVPDRKVVNAFLEALAPSFFWLYEEASNRGLHNDYLKTFLRSPGKLEARRQVSYLASELEKFGNIVKLHVY